MNKRKKVLFLLSILRKGRLRAELLKNDKIRNVVLSCGSNVTIYEGKVNKEADSVDKALGDVYVGLIQRKNKHGNFDGLGALGGLAERTNEKFFLGLPAAAQFELSKIKDDVIVVDGEPKLTKDIDIIRKNNVMREMQEELFDLGVNNKVIDVDKMELIPMPKVKDDNYIINIWDGTGESYAINPYCHIYKDDTGLIDSIIHSAEEKEGGEVAEYKKVPLLTALSAYGTKAEEYKLEDGRNATKDYRYPHEYLACWALASKLLGNDEQKMIELAIMVQKQSEHQISFSRIAKATSQSMEDVAMVLNISMSALEKMENGMHKIHYTGMDGASSSLTKKVR